MRKYGEVAKLTDEFLHGTLTKMDFEYENDKDVVVSISYEDTHNSRLDYRLRINEMTSVDFLSHKCRDSYGRIALNRDAAFERALTDYLVNA